jgi:hypothetical protein
MDIITVFHKNPKIIVSATDTLIKTAQHLQVNVLWMDEIILVIGFQFMVLWIGEC